MFQTNESYEIPVPEELGGNGARLWHCVESGLMLPWFHLTYRRHEQTRALFAAHLDVISEVARHPECAVVHVMLVSPPWLNGTRRWQMEELEEVSAARRQDGTDVTIYRVASKPEPYTDPEGTDMSEQFAEVTLLYRRA